MGSHSAFLAPDGRFETLTNARWASDVRNPRVLVAVSGGPDSTALLLALREAGRDIVAAHYDHALRDGSDAVARQVAELCARLRVPLITQRRTEALPKGSLQAAARSLRYAFLERARIEAGADVVALAHTADDVVEGSVLHLLRGCGLPGLRGMPERRGHFVRPMLGVWKSEVREFLRQRHVVPHEDPANLDTRFARVRVRREILPALERDRPGITRRFHAVALSAARLQEAAESLPTPAEAVKQLYVQAGGREPGLSRKHVEAMLKLAQPGRGGRGVDLPGGLRFRIVGDLMQVVPSHPPAQAARLEVAACPGCDDRSVAHLRTGLNLSVGYRRPGLRMRPAGGPGHRKLQDIFVDARVPREDRDGWPLVFAGDRLAWIPGLAVDADLAAIPGEPAAHVALVPFPVPSARKVARLENPEDPRGDLS